MDSAATLRQAVRLAALFHSLSSYAQETADSVLDWHLPSRLPAWIEKENHYQASRLGLEARLVSDAQGSSCSLRQLVEELLETALPTARSLDEECFLDELRDGLDSSSYHRQRQVFEKRGRTRQVVASLVCELEEGLPSAEGQARGCGRPVDALLPQEATQGH